MATTEPRLPRVLGPIASRVLPGGGVVRDAAEAEETSSADATTSDGDAVVTASAGPDPGTPDPPFLSLGPANSQLHGRASPCLAGWPPPASSVPPVAVGTPAAPEDLLEWTGERRQRQILPTLELDEPDGAPAPAEDPLGDPTVRGESLLPVVSAQACGLSIGKPSVSQSGDQAGLSARGILLLPPPCRTPRRE
jgi:hypothetical protein